MSSGYTAQLAVAKALLEEGRAQLCIDQLKLILKKYPNDPEVLRYLGLAHLQYQKLSEADHFFSRALRGAPDSPNLLNDLGIVRINQGSYELAVDFFKHALEINATHKDALNNLAATFITLRQPARAKEYLEQLVRLLPFSAKILVKSANNATALNDSRQALYFGRKAVRLAPDYAAARLSLAESLEASGRFTQAKFQYLSVLWREPGNVSALSRLLSLRGTNIAKRHEMQAEQLLKSGDLKDPARVRLHLGLARYYDHRQLYDTAFKHMDSGNTIKFGKHGFDNKSHSHAVDRLISTFTSGLVQALPSNISSSIKPIFIVGMPRSGTTLVEQILSSHSRIEAGGELSIIANLVAQMSQADVTYPDQMKNLSADDLCRMATQYLDKLDSVNKDAVHVTDKMPFNFMHLGLITALFPNATIIHCRRAPLDTCLSCYFTGFNESLQFASSLNALGKYYVDYDRLLSHWRSVLPSRMLEVDYETLVRDPDRTIRTLLEFCGVQWEPGCTEFYRTRRGIRTPSRWQVRQPIYRSSVGRWHHYAQHLQSLQTILSPITGRLSAEAQCSGEVE